MRFNRKNGCLHLSPIISGRSLSPDLPFSSCSHLCLIAILGYVQNAYVNTMWYSQELDETAPKTLEEKIA